jgi:hypothetical protein
MTSLFKEPKTCYFFGLFKWIELKKGNSKLFALATSPTAEISFGGNNGLYNLLHLFSSRYKLSDSV